MLIPVLKWYAMFRFLLALFLSLDESAFFSKDMEEFTEHYGSSYLQSCHATSSRKAHLHIVCTCLFLVMCTTVVDLNRKGRFGGGGGGFICLFSKPLKIPEIAFLHLIISHP